MSHSFLLTSLDLIPPKHGAGDILWLVTRNMISVIWPKLYHHSNTILNIFPFTKKFRHIFPIQVKIYENVQTIEISIIKMSIGCLFIYLY